MTKILIIGANGYLGARLYSDLKNSFDVVGTYHKSKFNDDFIQLDVTDQKQVDRIFSEIKPDIIIQTANYPSPRHAKDNEDNYEKLNLTSTRILVDSVNKIRAKLIFISSFAALNPDNIYGKLKLESEKVVTEIKNGYLILRPSLILGYSPNTQNDRPFNRVLKCLSNPKLAEFDTSWKFQPTYVGHISEVIKTAIEKNVFNHLIHVFCPSIETQFSTARDILQPFNVEVKPIDKGMIMPLQVRNESELTNLGLPTCTYNEMNEKINKEIREYLK